VTVGSNPSAVEFYQGSVDRVTTLEQT